MNHQISKKGLMFSKDSIWSTLSILFFFVGTICLFILIYFADAFFKNSPHSFLVVYLLIDFLCTPIGFILAIIGLVKKERLARLGFLLNLIIMFPLVWLSIAIP